MVVTLPSIPVIATVISNVPYDSGKTFLDSSANIDGGTAALMFTSSVFFLGILWYFIMYK